MRPVSFLRGLVGTKRKAIGKRLRFEIFKRDGFMCAYCGASPQVSVLRVDHVVAVANGGSNAPENLVTACHDCNGGKSAVPLERKTLPVGRVTDENRDHAEQIREWLALQREVSAAKNEVGDMLLREWESRCGSVPRDLRSRLPKMLEEVPPAKLIEAFQVVADRKPGYAYNTQIQYLYGVLRRWSTPHERPVAPPQPAKPVRSRHAERCWKSVCAAIEDARASGYQGDDIWASIMEAFASAAWVFPDEREYYTNPEYAHPSQWGLSTTANGVRIALRDGRVFVEDVPGFDPRVEAYEDLASIVSVAACPDNDAVLEMGSLYRRAEQHRMRIALLTESDTTGVTEFFSRTPFLAEILLTWTLDHAGGAQ
jgi:hypothetical protein